MGSMCWTATRCTTQLVEVYGWVDEVDWRKCRETHLHIFQSILLVYTSQDILLAAFLHLPGQEEFVQDKVCFLKVENDIQFANIPIVFVHLLNIAMNNLKGDQFVIRGRTTGDEEERCITTVDNFRV